MPNKPNLRTVTAVEQDLRARLEKAEESLREILSGESDALFVSGSGGGQLFALKGADQSYRTLIEDMSEGALTLTPAGLILYANRRFAEMLGTPLEKVIGSEIHNWFAPESRQVLQTLLRKDASDRRREELALAAADGTQVPVNLSVSHLKLEGMPDSFCMVATDLTEQKRNEAILAAESLARAILEQAADAIVICDETGLILRANKQAQALCGNNPVGQHFEHAFPLCQADGTAFSSIGDIDTNPRLSVEARLERDGQGYDLLVSVGHLKGTRDELLGSVVTFRDVTQRKQREQEMLATKKQLQETLDAIPDLLFELGLDGRYYAYHSPRRDLLATPPEEMLGKTVAEILPADAAEIVLAALREADATGRSTGKQFELALPQGRLWFELSISRMEVAAGQEARFICLSRDITERMNSENALRESELRYHSLFESMLEGYVYCGTIFEQDRLSDFIYLEVNDAFGRLTGLKDVVGKKISDVIPGVQKDNPELFQIYGQVALTGQSKKIETYMPALSAWLAITVYSSDREHFVAVFENITERKESEARIIYLNRVYAMRSGINALIVRVHDRDELFTEACRIALEAGGFRMALIVKVDRGSMRIVPVASAGKIKEILDAIKVRLSSIEDAPNTMIAQVIREKTLVVSNDLYSDLRFLLGKQYAEAGVRSLAIFPLIVEDEAAGAIAIYASETEFFHEEETKLLTGLAGDIAYALDHIGKAEKIARLSRIRAVLSGINAAIIRAKDRQELFNEACRVAVDQANFGSAWISRLDSDTHEAVQVACAGQVLHPDAVQVRIDVATGLGVASRAIREKRLVFDNDIAAPSSAGGERRALAIRAGFRSSIALPFVIDDVVVGHLSLYTKEPNFFNEDELQLLTELAGNISYALQSIDKRQKLEFLSYYDELTGLANRNLFLDRVAQYLHNAASNGHQLALFMIDLERFKNINDSLGWSAGDALLQQMAEWLKHNAGDANLVARLDADHFVAVLPVVKPGGNLPRLIEKSMEAILQHPFRLNEAVFRISVKVGVALFPDDGADAETLIRNAEAALKKAKASGERYLLHTQIMTAAVAGKLTLENQLRQALDNDEFVLHYQPKVNLASGQVTSAEALIRWNDPRTGLVPPGQFIPVLEDTGLIFEVGRWAINKAIADYLRWRASGLNALRVAVNVSPLQLRRRDFIDEIRRAINIDLHAAAGLELEITESLIMENIEHNIASLQAIRDLGVTIAIDDFGTGFSSLSYLAKLPVDTLKIDRSFVIAMTEGPEGLALVSTIIKMAHALHLKVVAEGVETEEQSRLLRLLECDEMQGFIFSKPVPCEIFESRYLTPAPVGVYPVVDK